ncbi:MAG: M48 family metalloprotease [Bacteroidia bacterium]|nr:M48 family metalloprotease [Bacteroidia bacterium]
MKKCWSILMGVLLLVPASAQVVNRPKAVLLTRVAPYAAGDTVRIIYGKEQGSSPDRIRRKYSTGTVLINEDDLRFVVPLDFWQKLWLFERAESLLLGETQPERRQMLLADNQFYEAALAEKGALYEDALITDYLTQVAMNIYKPWTQRSPWQIRVQVIRSPEPDAFTLSDGTILLSVGLLSLIRTEDELRVVLASQIAYLVSEYNLINYNREIAASNLRQALGLIAAVGVGALEAYSNYEYGTDFDGQAAVATGIVVSALTGSITRSVGASYSREQILRSQQVAVQYMRETGGDTMALGRLLMRMRTEQIMGNATPSGLERPSRYQPTLAEQLAQLGKISGNPDPAAEQYYSLMMGELIQEQAWQLFGLKRYELTRQYIDRLMATQQVHDETYLLAARLLRLTRDTPEDNAEGLRLAQAGFRISRPVMPELLIEEYLFQMRMQAYPDAAATLERLLLLMEARLSVWPADTYAQQKARWAYRMLQACKVLEAEYQQR